jgi:hypothetical protein
MIILCVLTKRCGERSCSRENAVADCSRNETSSVPQPWQSVEPADDGRRERCSLAPCRQYPLESHSGQMRLQEHVVGRLVNVPAEEVGRSLTPG